MKKNFKKSLAVFMAMLMLLSVVGVSAMAAAVTVQFLPGRYGSGTGPETVSVEKNTTITLPGASFTREGFVQTGWSTVASGAKKNYELGGSLKVTKNTKLYPYWEAVKCVVTFAPGEFGVGAAQTVEVSEGATTRFPGAVFTRDDYLMIGWSSTDGGAKEYGLTEETPVVMTDIAFYPVWEKRVYSIETDVASMNFGNVCEDYATPAAQVVAIKNTGNSDIEYALPATVGYNLVVISGDLKLEPNETVKISIQPKDSLGVADYSEALLLDADHNEADVTVNVMFVVNAHSFDKYISNNDATYEADGTKTAICSNGCGCVDTIIDIGSMKVYSVDNNTVDGLLDEYLYHKTIRVTAYGSGTDNIQADGTIAEGTKRFLPVSWYVNEEFNGEFTEGNYDINFVHTSFGKYTLKICYVEQEYVDGEWVDTGIEDEKSFDYYVGPSEKEEQEVIRPNMIVSIIFGLFAKLFELLFG